MTGILRSILWMQVNMPGKVSGISPPVVVLPMLLRRGPDTAVLNKGLESKEQAHRLQKVRTHCKVIAK
jgi:hypothetical protein